MKPRPLLARLWYLIKIKNGENWDKIELKPFQIYTLVFLIEVQDILINFWQFSSLELHIKERTLINFGKFSPQDINLSNFFHKFFLAHCVLEKFDKPYTLRCLINREAIYLFWKTLNLPVYLIQRNFPPSTHFFMS